MIDSSEKDGRLTFTVRVVPRASRTEIVGEQNGALRIRLGALPVEGAANEELICVLAKSFDVPRTSVNIDSGHTSRVKRVSVLGVKKTDLLRLAQL